MLIFLFLISILPFAKMKIFAKRKKKDVTKTVDTTATTSTPRTNFSSDPVVEELLLKDPSEWNSKQKRMVKRYQKRKAQEDKSNEDENASIIDDKYKEENHQAQTNEGREEADTPKDRNNVDEISNDVEQLSNDAGNKEMSSESASSASIPTETDKVERSHEIWKQLEQLNSKMKRTLSRKLDREGLSALSEVQNEANRLLGNTEDKSGSTNIKREASLVEMESTGKSKKKRKKEVDWSTLPPEERLRREEQRRLQKEAAQRRARGEDSSGVYKHPLNSERRRANRRKPKWKNTFKIEERKNHNASGFLARRNQAY